MADASFVRSSFVGGEYSKSVQGRYERPEYPTGLNVCQNGFPIETGAWVRRPGFQHAACTRNGLTGRLERLTFRTAAPYTMEFTDAHLRFFAGKRLVTTNDAATILGINTNIPANLFIVEPRPDWVTGNQVYISDPGPRAPILHNRQFELTAFGPTSFALSDPVLRHPLNGATFSFIPTAATRVRRILDFPTPYLGNDWRVGNLRVVQTENTAFLLNSKFTPRALTITAEPTPATDATFSLDTALFLDGPYLDPFTNGVMLNPDVKNGIVTCVLSLPPYDAARAYKKGDF